MGMVYINITKDDKLFKQLNYFNPPILLLFFVRSGVSFNLGILTGSGSLVGNVSVLTVGILYFITRIIGKYTGAFLGCLITGKSAEVRNYLGLALIPQAGVAIGLASLCVRSLGNDVGVSLQTIILASSCLLYTSKHGRYRVLNRYGKIICAAQKKDAGQGQNPVGLRRFFTLGLTSHQFHRF